MRIRFTMPTGMDGWEKDREMPAVPTVGESVAFGSDDDGGVDEYLIRHVIYYPDEPDFDVYVVLSP